MPDDLIPTTYCTPQDVADTLDLPDPTPENNYGTFTFSDASHPSARQVRKMIRSNEDIIDRRLKTSWRENRVVNEMFDINTYWHDINAYRTEYYMRGGYYIKLRKDVREWDPSKGDKLEVRRTNNQGDIWVDISDRYDKDSAGKIKESFWFDYPYGKLYLWAGMPMSPYNSLRITYRYGKVDEVPYAINRLCSLMTAINVINMQVFNIKVGSGGDMGSVKNDLIKGWQDEINSIYSNFQRSGSVHSLLG